jgi:hypothetical protein
MTADELLCINNLIACGLIMADQKQALRKLRDERAELLKASRPHAIIQPTHGDNCACRDCALVDAITKAES